MEIKLTKEEVSNLRTILAVAKAIFKDKQNKKRAERLYKKITKQYTLYLYDKKFQKEKKK